MFSGNHRVHWRRISAAAATAGVFALAAGCSQDGDKSAGANADAIDVKALVDMIARQVLACWTDPKLARRPDASGPTLVREEGNWYLLGGSLGSEVGPGTFIGQPAEGVDAQVFGTGKADWRVQARQGDATWHASAEDKLAEGACP
jgi:hypothetical protein